MTTLVYPSNIQNCSKTEIFTVHNKSSIAGFRHLALKLKSRNFLKNWRHPKMWSDLAALGFFKLKSQSQYEVSATLGKLLKIFKEIKCNGRLLTSVSEQTANFIFCRMCTADILSSASASLIPTQFLGPMPNGMK